MMIFADVLIDWHQSHGRHDLPWQSLSTPYSTWISEIMLQQTQVATVIPYFNRFIASFPTVESLAAANLDDVLSHWSGLGYYSRARNLHAAAVLIRDRFAGNMPQSASELETLPGIGRSTAAAILSLAFKQRATILDGNVKRVLTRIYGVREWPGSSAITKQLWHLAESLTPNKDCATYTQAIMDMGATLCTRSKPNCSQCPFSHECFAFKHGLQKQIPASKPKKAKPVKDAFWLMAQNDLGHWLVDKRVGKGVWQDLYAPYQYDSLDELLDSCELHIDQVKVLASFKHHFSHYSLDIHPVRYVAPCNDYTRHIGEQAAWYQTGTSQFGVPSAFTKLIDEETSPQ